MATPMQTIIYWQLQLCANVWNEEAQERSLIDSDNNYNLQNRINFIHLIVCVSRSIHGIRWRFRSVVAGFRRSPAEWGLFAFHSNAMLFHGILLRPPHRHNYSSSRRSKYECSKFTFTLLYSLFALVFHDSSSNDYTQHTLHGLRTCLFYAIRSSTVCSANDKWCLT